MVRQEWIEELDQQLTKAEDDRMDLVSNTSMANHVRCRFSFSNCCDNSLAV